jgi:hypothetical protein
MADIILIFIYTTARPLFQRNCPLPADRPQVSGPLQERCQTAPDDAENPQVPPECELGNAKSQPNVLFMRRASPEK